MQVSGGDMHSKCRVLYRSVHVCTVYIVYILSVNLILKALCHAIRADCLLLKPDAPTR